ncbi:MAG: NAD(P)H-binding protein [Anaerolineae bacterium]|jgi:NADH dehydrogenase|nr:NAD(P)H-binding protein [Anaerolineae bacterium]MBT7191535.1 NAD(P)H-binding protein [Anaerolineae bacterium]MBT7989526.1 NAD(P)H-binding protein [Anaerolineae bacterium]
MKIAVTGSFSYTGKYITHRLLERDDEVITLTGHPDNPNPFGDQVLAYSFNFDNLEKLAETLQGVEILFNTYWVRFSHGENTHERAVKNTKTLIKAAEKAGVKRIVHTSITNPTLDSDLPYFSGKADLEKAIKASSLGYAILRPTVLFGDEDILVNNIAWILRNFPVFGLLGDGQYRLQPIFVEDYADIAVEMSGREENIITDAVGPDIFTFEEMVRLIAAEIGCPTRLMKMPPKLALWASQIIGKFVGDIVLTQDEVDGLMRGLLISSNPPRAKTHLADWLKEKKGSVGMKYASEMKKHYR